MVSRWWGLQLNLGSLERRQPLGDRLFGLCECALRVEAIRGHKRTVSPDLDTKETRMLRISATVAFALLNVAPALTGSRQQ
jgi:hypothetical protein